MSSEILQNTTRWAEQAQKTKSRMAKGLNPIEAMGIDLIESTPAGAIVAAPLNKNLNDKATAFAGSIASVAALAGWSYVTTLSEVATGRTSDVAIYQCHLDYLHPVRSDLIGHCLQPETSEIEKFLESLALKGRGKISVSVEVHDENQSVAATMTAKYFAQLAE